MTELAQFEQVGTHRLIPAKYGAESVFESLSLPSNILADLSELDAATNERKIAENGGSMAIGPGELLLGVPEARIVNAAFTHPGPFGGCFHSPQRGAWYAGLEIETLIAEVAFHKRLFLTDGRIQGQYAFDYIDFLADFSGLFHTLDAGERESCLLPGPVPQCYSAPQSVANRLLFEGSKGIVYPGIRHPFRNLHCVFPSELQLLISPELAPQQLQQVYRVTGSSPLLARYSLRSPWFHFQ